MANANKRKRDQHDHGPGAPHPHPPAGPDYSPYMNHHGDGEMELAEALSKHNASGVMNAGPADGPDQAASDTASAALNFSMPAPPAPEANFLVRDDSADQSEPPAEPNFDIGSPNPPGPSAAPAADSDFAVDQLKHSANNHANSRDGARPETTRQPAVASSSAARAEPDSPSPSPPEDDNSASPSANSRHKVGSDEWAASRRLAHKEVERRRREAINDGISELGKIVPGAERNKGSILHRAVQYINELKDRQVSTDQKNNLEKMVFEQAIAEVTASADKLKTDVRRLEAEVERWRSVAEGR